VDVNNLVSASPIVKYGPTTVTYSATQPSGPVNGDLWIEPGSRYPGPWEWEDSSSRWYSPPVDILFPIEANVIATTRRRSATEFYNSQYGTGAATKLCFVNIFIAGGAAAHSATNYFSFNIEYLLGSGVVTNLITTTDNTGTSPSALGANGLRRINQVTSSYFPGNAWTIGYRALLNGTGVSIAELSVKITVKYPRP
jgi:hypothetical protein